MPVKPPKDISLQEEVQQLKAIVHDVRECQMLTAQNTAKEIAALKAEIEQLKAYNESQEFISVKSSNIIQPPPRTLLK